MLIAIVGSIRHNKVAIGVRVVVYVYHCGGVKGLLRNVANATHGTNVVGIDAVGMHTQSLGMSVPYLMHHRLKVEDV